MRVNVPIELVHSLMPIVENAANLRAHAPYSKGLHRSLRGIPNCVLVEVHDDGSDEGVRIAKQGRNLVIDGRSPEETVHASVPIRLLGAVLSRIESTPRLERDEAASGAASASAWSPRIAHHWTPDPGMARAACIRRATEARSSGARLTILG